MRVLDATLEAGLIANKDVYINAHFTHKTTAATWDTTNIVYYKIGQLDLELKFKDTTKPTWVTSNNAILHITRGIISSGVNYTIDTSEYIITDHEMDHKTYETRIKAHVFTDKYITTPADVQVDDLLDTIMASSYVTGKGYANAFQWPTPVTQANLWFKNIKFYPAGKSLDIQSARNLDQIFRQKYLATLSDIGGNIITLTDASLPNIDEGTQTAINPITAMFKAIVGQSTYSLLYFTWRDENATIHSDGTATDRHHHLGYIESTVTPDELQPFDPTRAQYFISPPDLRLQSGDFIASSETNFSITNNAYMTITEIFDRKSTPTWYMILEPVQLFTNTAGGALPSTIERVAAYTPLVTTGFDNNLDETVNNLQALAEAVDELTLGSAVHEADTSDAHDASAISVLDTGGLITATDVEAALAELATSIAAGAINYDQIHAEIG